MVPTSSLTVVEYDDDEAEGGDREGESKPRNKKKQKGQNHKRDLKQKKDIIKLCPSLIDPEDDRICQVGADKCRFHHDIASYLESKPQDIDGICPVFEALGYCPTGIKCRWLKSHYNPKPPN